nr:ATP-binding protein [Sedimentibacter acidaminivorans]
MVLDKRLVIITGHYGSGKTEFAVNYAVKMKNSYSNVSLADLDIVNPYFRSREKKILLEDMGIQVLDSSINNQTLDLPALPAGIMGSITNLNMKAILDIGGDPVGARVLARFSDQIKMMDYDLFYVINGNRPETQTKENVIRYLKDIESTSGLKVTGLINNTHLLKDTSVSDVELGHELSKEVSWEIDVPIRYESAMMNIADKIVSEEIKAKLFPLNLYMREEWMS